MATATPLGSLTRVLLRAGFDVRFATNGREALDLISEHVDDVIVTDIKMPVMDGMELYERLEHTRPEAARRVLFVTAWAQEPSIHEFLARAERPVLEKPFEMDELVETVRRVAEGSHAPPGEETTEARGASRPEEPVSFSLEEIAQIREKIVTPGALLECPRCGTRLTTGLPIAGGGSIAAVWELRCESCNRFMIVSDLPEQ